jgi:nitrogen fixation protein NifB
VTSSVLSPEQALLYLEKVLEKEPRITVVGIAGPGDPFANGEQTMTTLRLIRERFPEMILCVSSNGLEIGPYIDELAALKVSHVTITVCAVDPEIGQQIYGWVQDGKILHKGLQGATLLLSRQLAAIKQLKAAGVTVKVNNIIVPGINDGHIEAVAATMKELGVDLLNCMAMFPNVDTPFADLPQPSKETMEDIRAIGEQYLPQMRHCTRCRADAVGLLDDDRTEEFRGCLSACAQTVISAAKPQERPYVAIATIEGVLINQHLGEAKAFQIWEPHQGAYRMVEERPAPEQGGGIKRWHRLARILGDCRAVLISSIGETPYEILQKSGVQPIEASGFIEAGLKAVYEEQKTSQLKGRNLAKAFKKCGGSGAGCG